MGTSISFREDRMERIILAWSSYNKARDKIDSGDWSFRDLESFITNACEHETKLLWKDVRGEEG